MRLISGSRVTYIVYLLAWCNGEYLLISLRQPWKLSLSSSISKSLGIFHEQSQKHMDLTHFSSSSTHLHISTSSAFKSLWSCCLKLKSTCLDKVWHILQVLVVAMHLLPQLYLPLATSAIGEYERNISFEYPTGLQDQVQRWTRADPRTHGNVQNTSR